MSDTSLWDKINRRTLLKALISVPVLGGLALSVLKKKSMDDAKRRALLADLGVSEGSPAVIPNAISRPPSRTIRLGIIGFGGEGESLARHAGFAHPEWLDDQRKAVDADPRNKELDTYLHQDDVHAALTSVCDLFDVRAERAIAASRVDTRPSGGRALPPAKRYRRYTDLLASDDVDAVIIATPDHWHARIALAAVDAGKHVYCEKCMTRTEAEALALHEAVSHSNIVFQLGHQNRASAAHNKAREVIAANILGKVTLVETTTNRNSPGGAWVWDIHKDGNPHTIDWEQFQEPAAHRVPFSPERFFRWRCWFDYATGLSGDLLSHEYDAVNQVMQMGIPHTASSSGGTYFYKDGRDVPDVFQAVLEYPERDLTVVYSATLANGRDRGLTFMGHDASMQLGNGLTVWVEGESTRFKKRLESHEIDPSVPMFTYQPGFGGIDAVTSASTEYFASRGLLYTYHGGRRFSAYHLHVKEWLDAIREGGRTSCNIERGFEEAITCHMATRSFLEGRRVTWDPVRRRIA
ncbi:MAG: Gfo/Idh/MocA family protein [Gemmatimonadales bacterium]